MSQAAEPLIDEGASSTEEVAPSNGARSDAEAGVQAPLPDQLHSNVSLPKATTVWWVATTLLLLMAVLYGVTTYLQSELLWVRMVRAFSEAALVGALADWFAVTALFRRPLGLPIPHTGIIPANKSRIGKSLGLFVQRNFLTEQALDSQVVNISGSFARFLQNPSNRGKIVERVRALVPRLLEVANDDEVKKFLNQQVEDIVRNADLARSGAKILRTLTSNQAHEVMLDEIIQQLRGVFRSNQVWFRHQLREAAPWFIPAFVDRKIFDAIMAKTEQTFADALAQKNHELRQRIMHELFSLIVRLETSDELRAKVENFKGVLLQSDVFREYVGVIRDSMLAGIDADVRKGNSVLLSSVEKMLRDVVEALSQSPSLQRKLNRLIRSMLSALVGQESTFVADLISKTIDGWDSKTLVAKLEEQVGADLQYIRINGTLVGGLVGLVLFGLG